MKKLLLSFIGVALLATVINLNAQTVTPAPDPAVPATTSFWAGIGNAVAGVFKNNPSNTWDVSTYALNNITEGSQSIAKGWGAGARAGYWITPSIGATFDLSYCDHSWTAASLGLTARGTFPVGSIGSLTTYVYVGPGWNLATANGVSVQSLVVVTGGGGQLHLNALKFCDLFGEYRHITTSPQQNEVVFGITKHF